MTCGSTSSVEDPLSRLRPTWIMGLLCILVAISPTGALAKKQERRRLPVWRPYPKVAHEVTQAFESRNIDRIRRLASEDHDHTGVLSAILFRPNAPREAQREIASAYVKHLKEDNPARAFGAYWLQAEEADYKRERAYWRHTGQIAKRLRTEPVEDVLRFLDSQMSSVRNDRHSYARFMLWSMYIKLLRRSKRLKEAINERELMIRAATESGDHARAAEFCQERFELMRYAGAFKAAEQEGKRAAKLLIRSRRWGRAATVLTALADAARVRRDYKAAERHIGSAMAIATDTNDPTLIASVCLARSEIAVARREYTHAIELKIQVWKMVRGLLDNPEARTLVVRSLTHLVNLMRLQALMQEAIRYGHQLDAALSSVDGVHQSYVARARLSIASLELSLDNQQQAYAHFKGARALLSNHALLMDDRAMAMRGELLTRTPDKDNTSENDQLLEKYRELTRRIIKTRPSSFAWASLSRVEFTLGHHAAARTSAEKALELASESSPSAFHAIRARVAMAHVHIHDHKWEEAIACLKPTTSQTLRPQSVAYAHSLSGSCALKLGRFSNAIDHFREAITKKSQVWRGVGLLSRNAQRHTVNNLAGEGMRAAFEWSRADPSKQAQALEAAWWFGEAGRAQAMAQALVSGKPTNDSELRNQYETAMERVETLQREHVLALAYGETKHQQRLRPQLDAALRAAHEAAKALDARRRPPATMPTLVSLEEARGALNDDECVLRFHLAQDEFWGMAASKRGASIARIGSTNDIAELITAWRDLASIPGGRDEKVAHTLYNRLIAPFQNVIGDAKHLCVVPDGAIATIPVDALVAEIGGKPRPTRVIERFSVCYAQSYSVYKLLRARRSEQSVPRGIVALGGVPYPHDASVLVDEGRVLASRLRGGLTLPPLPATRAEVERIGALFASEHREVLTGKAATIPNLMKHVRDRSTPLDVLHIATHGLADNATPSLSGLVLAGGSVLTAERIERTRIPARLAVLSACDSGSGTHSPGEGLLGLTRSLMAAGVSQVVCSTWQLADTHAAEFMVAMHKRRKALKRTSEALRQTRLDVLRKPETTHPFYWAGYQLWGGD